ncbi:acyl-CoA synthetase [Cupriavidus consociatus]|uniref:acyl-CoA synthetase n=1 Tax=Cupriavidus consociatus TaxID=2821357 RepID=UPI001AE28EBA|nr:MULTISPECIES: AMP-binding protein [unclassified Cupriavidus]MBP0622314.1 AMP-binding protein [Cupriavidus sp. LEh25]MDK2658995.1 AMP-binding protein [Cupriavidus sp. LEh21]
MPDPMTAYADTYERFRWCLPASFNFGRDVVDAHARQQPDKLALLWCDHTGAERRYTFGDMRRLTNRCANLLAGAGVRRGDRVIVMLPRIAHWQIAMVACLKLGAVPIPCIEMLTAKDIGYRIDHAGATAVIAHRGSFGKFDGIHGIGTRIAVGGAPDWIDFDAALAGCSDEFTCADLAPDEPAILYYTSGSTGNPKGVLHATRALYSWRVSATHWQGLRADDLMWCTADTGWSKAGTSILFGPWSVGTAVLFYNGPFDPAERLALIARHGVTVFCGAATEFRHLVNARFADHDLSRLRLAASAGEAVNPEVVRRWREATGVELREGYGQTETLMTVVNPPDMPTRAGSMGLPLPGSVLAVLDEQGRPLPPGASGQLALRLPHPQVMLGYWNDPALTATTRAQHEGTEYFLTGDLAHADTDGFLYYDGRSDDIISSAGYRIGPMEVENALIEHPAVLECAVVGSPDAERGEIVKAFVTLRPGFTPDEALARALQDHVKQITAPYKYPRAIAFVDALPKTASGKLMRRLLREREYAAHGAPSQRA